jgi:hypothetical protein
MSFSFLSLLKDSFVFVIVQISLWKLQKIRDKVKHQIFAEVR